MSSDLTRRTLALTALAALAGCGFAPAFGDQGTAQKLRGAVAVTAPATTLGFALRQRVADRLGATTAPRYALTIEITQETEAAAITTDGDTTRFQLIGVATWALTDTGGSALTQGRAETFTSYAATGSTVATQAAAGDAADRLARTLADQIVDDLTLAAGKLP